MKLKSIITSSLLATSLLLSASASALLSDEIIAAQKRLEEAARDYAELTAGLKGDNANVFVKSFKYPKMNIGGSKARLGIHIGNKVEEENDNGVVTRKESNTDGVVVFGITQKGPAEAAGLKEGDVITHLNGQSLLNGDDEPLQALFKFMKDVQPGDVIDVSYTRDGIANVATLTTDEMPSYNKMMLDGLPNSDIDIEIMGDGLDFDKNGSFKIFGDGNSKFKTLFINRSPLGDAELVEISPELGEYFDADNGLLVVKAPSDKNTELRDGDVITAIDGRELKTVSHATRILRSYEAGEKVKLNILRKKRKTTVSLEVPERPENPLLELHGDNEVFKWKKKEKNDK